MEQRQSIQSELSRHTSEAQMNISISGGFIHMGTINSQQFMQPRGKVWGHGRLGEDGASSLKSGCIHSFAITHYHSVTIHSVTHPPHHHSWQPPSPLTHYSCRHFFPHSLTHSCSHSSLIIPHFTHSLIHSVIYSPPFLQKSLGRDEAAAQASLAWPVKPQENVFSPSLQLYYKDHLYFELLDLGQLHVSGSFLGVPSYPLVTPL